VLRVICGYIRLARSLGSRWPPIVAQVDTPATWDRCLRDGHDGILTDDPAGAAAYVAAIRAKLFGSLTLEELEKVPQRAHGARGGRLRDGDRREGGGLGNGDNERACGGYQRPLTVGLTTNTFAKPDG